MYLTSWYWAWIEYHLVFSTYHLSDPEIQLSKAIEIISRSVEKDVTFLHVDEVALNRIIINEYSKSYLTKEVDSENKEGYFVIYKRLVGRLRDMILRISPDYRYPTSLASTIIEGALHQHYLKEHFSSITDCTESVSPEEYFIHLAMNTIKGKSNE